MAHAWIIALAVPLLAGLLHFEKRDHVRGKLVTKTPLSLLFVLAAFVQPGLHPVYFRWLAAGLLLCAAGDVLLAFGDPRTFRLGLFAFLSGHLCYVPAFWTVGHPGWAAAVVAIAAVAAGVVVYRWLRSGLGDLRGPVVAYIVVISVMLASAAAVAGSPALPAGLRAMVGAGALLFYLSDLFVARQRFAAQSWFNRLVGLSLYYTGQFLLAFSAGAF